METIYKGYTIKQNPAGGFTTLRKFYQTENAAKGAITKHIKAAEEFEKEAEESDKVMAELVYAGLVKHGKPQVYSQKYLSRAKREGQYAGKVFGVHSRTKESIYGKFHKKPCNTDACHRYNDKK